MIEYLIMEKNFYFMTSPIGILKLESDRQGITRLEICHDNPDHVTVNNEEPACPISAEGLGEP